MIDFTGRVAIVTGAAQGVGADIAQALCNAGARVVAADLQVPQWDHAHAVFQKTDLARDEDIAACVGATRDHFGRLDILVNCAVTYLDHGLESSRADWMRTLNVNLIGPALLTAKAAEALTSPGGVVVNIGSVGGKVGAAERALYPASKAALLQFTRNAAVTLAPRGIRVLSVSPGWTWSPTLERLAHTQSWADKVGGALHPLGRVGRGADVANAVLFACSSLAGFITGTDIAVDGGFTALGPDVGKGPRGWFVEEKPPAAEPPPAEPG